MSRDDPLAAAVCEANRALPTHGLVTWTSGNVSARVPDGEAMLIKPSGVDFDDLSAASMVRCDLDGAAMDSELKPSSDAATHGYIYRHLPHVGAVVHTHSTYATAWAALGRDIPCVLTAMADEFGGPVPCAGFALIGGPEIGREVVRVLDGHRSPAVLLDHHGVFTIGATPRAALKAAVMVEDVARTVHLAHQLGEPVPIGPDDIDRLHRRYQEDYGQ